ncbi:MAG: sodium-dependent transporter [Oscillibacter sp.]|nr:sodium-dependent transporter [Oscillibacter sp.]
MAAIGSAVGLGNIWGFPYKMGRSGGFMFLIVYVLLAIFVGFSIMMSELAMGRKTGKGTIGAYQALSSRFKWVGWLAVFSPFVILSFYTVLGGYCIEYMSLNLSNLAFGGAEVKAGADLFGAMLTNPFGCVMFTFLFMIICYLINRGGISGGIEKFNNVGMPALFVMLVIIIIRSVTLPGAAEGLKFMFVPGYAVQAGFIEEAPSLVSVLATAGGQMFFSLSLAMGITITYGSYMKKEQNIVKNSVVVVFADTLVALMAGVAVIPAAVATYGPSATLSGPKLLFITLQDVFQAMGAVGPLFGVIFYLFVLVAAISSAIALIEVITTFFLDRAESKGKQGSRPKTVFWVCFAVMVEAAVVALDGLGSNVDAAGNALFVPVPFQKLIGIGPWNDNWLDFMDAFSEGLAMPAGALLMSIMIGWEIGVKPITDEIHHGAEQIHWLNLFMKVCLMFIVPLSMAFILGGQIGDFFTMDPATQGKSVYYIGYAIGIALMVIAWIVARTSPKRKENNQ